tara:strand:+ start:416 stop:670 length:255 start_codon:yes stop_codon:yes gene_type:complete
MKYYVFSGSLKGVEVDADYPAEAVEKAVLRVVDADDDVVLAEAIRVSHVPHGEHHLDIYFGPPYLEQFPALEDLVYLQVPVERI